MKLLSNYLKEMKIAPTGSGAKGARGFKAGGPAAGFGAGARANPGTAEPVPLARISSAEQRRLPVEPAEVARVLGGGLVEGSVILLGGEPGVGKSTLLTGLGLWWVRQGVRVLYVAGEESPAQIRMRAERLGFKPDREDGFSIIAEVHLESLLETLTADREAAGDQPCVIIADSIQTLHSEHVDAYPGAPTQIKYCGGVLSDFARRTGCPIFLVGHVTKSGDLAGPKLLEHMVDTVLYFEGSGGGAIRLVRAVKNRFGTTGELAVMEMRADGLFPVDEAAVLFWGYRTLGPLLPSPALISIWAMCHQNALMRRDSVLRTLGDAWKDENPFAIAAELFRRILDHGAVHIEHDHHVGHCPLGDREPGVHLEPVLVPG